MLLVTVDGAHPELAPFHCHSLSKSVSMAVSVLVWELYAEKTHCSHQRCTGYFRIRGFSGEIQTDRPKFFPSQEVAEL